MANGTRTALSAPQNARNHTVTGILSGLVAGKLAAMPALGLDETGAVVLAGALVGGTLGFLGSVARSFTAARGGESLSSSLGRRLAQWVG